MTWILWLFVVGSFGYDFAVGQRVAPGVPPQHYQQQQHIPQQQQQQQQQQQYQQQQYQQPPPPSQQFQQQQVPVQQQQVPVQHQQVPVQHQQQANIPQGGHGVGHGHAHNGPPQVLNAANIAEEKEHIREHLDVPMDTSKMTDQELQFHYFKMHDADNNNKLDGCELIKSLIHWHVQGNNVPSGSEPSGHDHQNSSPPPPNEKLFTDEELVNLIDPILNMDDTNKDGFIDYSEFILAQQKAAAPAKP